MTLALPEPAPPAPAARAQRQAFRQWQTGRGHAREQRWPAAALSFAQGTGLLVDPG
jgi:hypothetical protein